MRKDALLEVDALQFAYSKERTILNHISFSIGRGEIFVLLGPNGAGKSTLLFCLSGFFRDYEGEIRLKGRNIKAYSTRELSQNIGYVPQINHIQGDYKVRDYVAMGTAPYLGLFSVPTAKEYKTVDNILEKMGIASLSQRPINQLSGGEFQQVQIARTFLQKPDLILMDEPTNHLDFGNINRMLQRIKELSSQEGVSVLLTSHMPDHALVLNGNVGILNRDGTMQSGAPERIMTEEILSDIYDTNVCLPFVPEVHRYVCLNNG